MLSLKTNPNTNHNPTYPGLSNLCRDNAVTFADAVFIGTHLLASDHEF